VYRNSQAGGRENFSERYETRYEGTKGELSNLHEDPRQWRNLWNDAGYAQLKSDLISDLYDHLPRPRDPQLQVEAPA